MMMNNSAHAAEKGLNKAEDAEAAEDRKAARDEAKAALEALKK